MQTSAWVCNNPQDPFQLESLTIDSPRADEVLVEIGACGICHMDIAGKSVLPVPCVLGHEGAGIVRAIGSRVRNVQPGQRVIMSYGRCGTCGSCLHGEPFHCQLGWDVTFSGHRLDGSHTHFRQDRPVSASFFQQSSFAKHALCPAANLVPVTTDLPDSVLAALPCGVLTGVGIVTRQFALQSHNSLLVLGAGAVGLAAVMAAKRIGVSSIVAVDLHESRLKLAQELGATHTVKASHGPLADSISAICGEGVEFIIDTTGSSKGLEVAIDSLRVGGRLALLNLPAPMEDFSFKPFLWFTKSASLEAVSFGRAIPQELLPEIISWHEAGEFPVEKLIKVYPFEELNRACEDSLAGLTIKPVIQVCRQS